MNAETARRAEPVLDLYERLSEVLFGVIMTLTITSSMRVGFVGRDSARELLVAAIGCNLAWGIVDAVMYLLGNLTERGHRDQALGALRAARGPAEGRRVLAEELPGELGAALTEDQLESLRGWLVAIPTHARGRLLSASDLRGALGVFLLVVASTFPVVLPFLLVGEPTLAFRLSNGIAIAMMVAIGAALGRHAGRRPLPAGLALGALGVGLVLLTIALGG